MAKIIKIENDIVSIGTDGGAIEEVRISDLNFTPIVGDEVDIFKTETNTIVAKKEQEQKAAEGININISNSNGADHKTAAQGKVVNKATFCLLAFFLGGIGIHKFYAGKTGMGILYLVFCWTGIPAVAALIEFIIALTMKSDANGNIIA